MKKIFTFALIFIFALVIYSQNDDNVRMPMLGESAPSFNAQSTNGDINFPDDYFGKWKIIFSHPAAFTPVCTSELLELAYLQSDFDDLGTELIVLSTDGLNSQIEWVKSMETIDYRGMGLVDIKFPVISDANYTISRNYGMIHSKSGSTKDIRAVFVIDPDNKIRTIFYYPQNVGRNIDEIKRTLVALQQVDPTQCSYTCQLAKWR